MMHARTLAIGAGLAIAAHAPAQNGYQWTPMPGLVADGIQFTRFTSITLADPDGANALPTQPIVVGSVRTSAGSSPQWVLRWDGAAWIPLTPNPPGLNSLSNATTLQATNYQGRLRLHGLAFPSGGSIVTYGTNSWTSTITGDAVYPNPASVFDSGIIYSAGSGPFKVFDGFAISGSIPAPDWFQIASDASSRTRGTANLFGQLYAFGGVGQGDTITQPGVFFYLGPVANPWVLLGGSAGQNIGDPSCVGSIGGDLYLGTRGNTETPLGRLCVRRNSSPNSWQQLATFYFAGQSFDTSGILAMTPLAVNGQAVLIIAGGFDQVSLAGGATITGCPGVIGYNGNAFFKLGPGFGGNVHALVASSDLRTIYFAGQTNTAQATPIVQRWEPAPCYANCDGSTASPALSAADFVCFLDRFRTGNAYANCDGSTGSPALTAADFVCYLASFRAGCP